MTFKITNKDTLTYLGLLDDLIKAGDALEKALSDYNDALAACKEEAEHIAGTIQDTIDEKSESWQAGENGEAASTLQQAWEQADWLGDEFETGAAVSSGNMPVSPMSSEEV